MLLVWGDSKDHTQVMAQGQAAPSTHAPVYPEGQRLGACAELPRLALQEAVCALRPGSCLFAAALRAPVPLSSLINFPRQAAWWASGFQCRELGSFQVK